MKKLGEESRSIIHMKSDEDIVKYTQVHEKIGLLKCSTDPLFGYFMRLGTRYDIVFELNFTVSR